MDKIEEYKAFPIPKPYQIAEKIYEAMKNQKEIEIVHTNGANDIYKSPILGGIILVDKKDKNFDIVEISGNVKGNKLRLEELTGEKLGK